MNIRKQCTNPQQFLSVSIFLMEAKLLWMPADVKNILNVTIAMFDNLAAGFESIVAYLLLQSQLLSWEYWPVITPDAYQ